jgi:hypothetical protein
VAGAAPFTGKSAAAGFLAVAAALLLAGCHTPMPPDRRSPPSHVPNTPDAPGALAAPYRRPAMTMDEYRLQFAARLMAANPGITYTEPAPNPLLAIPVLEIEVNGDGSVRHIEIVRTPTQATDTVQIAIDAVRRAAPFGDATHLPRPWKFTEVFLFDDERRFKPRILD